MEKGSACNREFPQQSFHIFLLCAQQFPCDAHNKGLPSDNLEPSTNCRFRSVPIKRRNSKMVEKKGKRNKVYLRNETNITHECTLFFLNFVKTVTFDPT